MILPMIFDLFTSIYTGYECRVALPANDFTMNTMIAFRYFLFCTDLYIYSQARNNYFLHIQFQRNGWK